MLTAVIVVAALGGGFVFGVLYGRKNKKSIETIVTEAEQLRDRVTK